MSSSLVVVVTFMTLLVTNQKCLATNCCWWNCFFMRPQSTDDVDNIRINPFDDIKSANTSTHNIPKPALIKGYNKQPFTGNPLRRIYSATNTSNKTAKFHLHQLKDNDFESVLNDLSSDTLSIAKQHIRRLSNESSDIKIIYSPDPNIASLTLSSSHFESGQSSIYKEKKQMLWNETQQSINKSCKDILSLLPVATTFRVYSQGFQTVEELRDFILQQCINRFTELYFNTNISINESSTNEHLVVFNLHETIVANAQSSVSLTEAGMKLFRQINAQELKINIINGRMIMYRPKFIRFMWELRKNIDFAFYEEQLDLEDTYHHIVTLETFYKHILPGSLIDKSLTEDDSMKTRNLTNFKIRFIHHNQYTSIKGLRHAISSLNDVIANESRGMYKNVFKVQESEMNWLPNSVEAIIDDRGLRNFKTDMSRHKYDDSWFRNLGKYIRTVTKRRISFVSSKIESMRMRTRMEDVHLSILTKTAEQTVNEYNISSHGSVSPVMNEILHRGRFQIGARPCFRVKKGDSSSGSRWSHKSSSSSSSAGSSSGPRVVGQFAFNH